MEKHEVHAGRKTRAKNGEQKTKIKRPRTAGKKKKKSMEPEK